jgi:U4/U6 small nuclear ribonucleoprotein PRP3
VTAGDEKGIEPKVTGDSLPETIDDTISCAPITLMSSVMVPPYPDPVMPVLEWWDEAFLPKERRDLRKISKAATSEIDDVQLLAVQNARTYKLVQHPVPVKPIGGDKGVALALPMYMTKEERKKLRRTTRKQRELEKRDKMMMGLIPAPEPKFKLSNFMKVLGDQAVADPSKVEMKVLQQMQQRVLNHEMRNQAAKLTPQQRKEKRLRKLQEDTSRAVHVAVFRVKDFSNLKYRFKVDVNAQQRFLSGVGTYCLFHSLPLFRMIKRTSDVPMLYRRYVLCMNSAALHRGRGSQSGGGGGRSEGGPEVHQVDAREVTEQLHLID